VIDDWKLPIFARHLRQGGYAYEHGDGVTSDTLNLYVETEDLTALERVVRAANNEAGRSKMRTHN
jgi:hypothetical protein